MSKQLETSVCSLWKLSQEHTANGETVTQENLLNLGRSHVSRRHWAVTLALLLCDRSSSSWGCGPEHRGPWDSPGEGPAASCAPPLQTCGAQTLFLAVQPRGLCSLLPPAPIQRADSVPEITGQEQKSPSFWLAHRVEVPFWGARVKSRRPPPGTHLESRRVSFQEKWATVPAPVVSGRPRRHRASELYCDLKKGSWSPCFFLPHSLPSFLPSLSPYKVRSASQSDGLPSLLGFLPTSLQQAFSLKKYCF